MLSYFTASHERIGKPPRSFLNNPETKKHVLVGSQCCCSVLCFANRFG